MFYVVVFYAFKSTPTANTITTTNVSRFLVSSVKNDIAISICYKIWLQILDRSIKVSYMIHWEVWRFKKNLLKHLKNLSLWENITVRVRQDYLLIKVPAMGFLSNQKVLCANWGLKKIRKLEITWGLTKNDLPKYLKSHYHTYIINRIFCLVPIFIVLSRRWNSSALQA